MLGLFSSTYFTTSFTITHGLSSDTPVPGDYDGDGKTDVTVFRPSTHEWLGLRSDSNNTLGFRYLWGNIGDIPVPGDYDGDQKTDVAIYRPSTSEWWILKSSSGFTAFETVPWGDSGALPSDIVAPGDYDGDGLTDLALFTAATGGWLVLESTGPALRNGEVGVTGPGTNVIEFATVSPALQYGDWDGHGTASADWRVGASTTWIAMVIRFTDPNNFVLARYQDGELGIFRKKGGVWAPAALATRTVTNQAPGVHRLRVDAVEGTIRAVWDNEVPLVATDTEGMSGRGAGLAWWTAHDAASTADNFTLSAAVPNIEPFVTLTAPQAATLTPPASISIAATATDYDGAITRVEFFANGTLIGNPTAPPYALTYSGVGPGTYRIVAKAHDSRHAVTTSSEVEVIVACTYLVTQTETGIGPLDALVQPGGSLTFAVATQAGCEWSAGAGPAWAPRTGEANRVGSGSVTYAVGPNQFGSLRTATLMIAGTSIGISQVPCSYSVTQTDTGIGQIGALAPAGGLLTFAVATQATCGWSAGAGPRVGTANWRDRSCGGGLGDVYRGPVSAGRSANRNARDRRDVNRHQPGADVRSG